MPDKRDGTPQAKRGKAKTLLDDIADPKLLLTSKLGPGQLLPELTREEKAVFAKATSIGYERWIERVQENIRPVVDEMIELLAKNLDKIPPAYLTMNITQLLQYATKAAQTAAPASSNHLHIHARMSKGDVLSQLFAPPKPAETLAQGHSVPAMSPTAPPPVHALPGEEPESPIVAPEASDAAKGTE